MNSIRIYCAATFSEQERIRQYKEKLFRMGHVVISSWLDEQVKPIGMTEDQFAVKMANKDLREIMAADCFILDMDNPSRTAGKMVETGFAIANHKLFYVVGNVPNEAIFCFLADKIFNNWDELFEFFETYHKAERNEYVVRSKNQHVDNGTETGD